MCYQARRTAWAKIQTVHVQLWWADLNLENRAWKKVNNRTLKRKVSSPKIPKAMFWAQAFRAGPRQIVAWHGENLHGTLHLARRLGCFRVILRICGIQTWEGLRRSSKSTSFYRWTWSTPVFWSHSTSQSERDPVFIPRLPNYQGGTWFTSLCCPFTSEEDVRTFGQCAMRL